MSTTSRATSPEAEVDTTVLIVGGGIGGLALAGFLRRLDIPFIVLERYEKITPVGAGISLAPNCLAAIEQLGLYDFVQENGQELRKVRIHQEKQEWKSLNMGLAKSWFGYNVYSVERHSFHQKLLEAAGGLEFVRLGCSVEDIVDDENLPYVTVKMNGNRELKSRVVVGADGIRSITRRVLATNAGMKGANTIQFTGRVHMSGYTKPLEHLTQDDLGVANWMLYNDSILTTWPCIDNRQWFIGVKSAEKGGDPDHSVWRGANQDTVNEVYGNKYHPFADNGKVSGLVKEAERVIASNVFAEVSFPSMTAGRVALLGDAAHSMTSFFGQGGCQAIEDATELANHLAKLFPDPSFKSAPEFSKIATSFVRYSDIREARAKDVSDFSAMYARMHTATMPSPGWKGQWFRWLIYDWAPSWTWMWYLRWLYGYQPTVEALPKVTKKDQ